MRSSLIASPNLLDPRGEPGEISAQCIPVLFSIPTPWGAIPIYSYGVMLGSSLLFAWYFIMYMGKKIEGYNRELLASSFTWTAVGAIIGARLLYIFTNLDSYESLGSWFDLRSGGLVAYGGFLGGFVTALTFWRIKKIPLLPFADVAVPTLASGLMFTRVGCYLYGCDYGRPFEGDAPSWLSSAGTFPKWDTEAFPTFACDQAINGSPAYQHHLQEYPDLMVDRVSSLAVHPTQIYESAFGLVLFVFSRVAAHPPKVPWPGAGHGRRSLRLVAVPHRVCAR